MQMKQFPREVSHVVLLSAIPMLYPGLGILESLLNAFNNFPARLLFKTGNEPPLSSSITSCMLRTRHRCSLALPLHHVLMQSQAYILEALELWAVSWWAREPSCLFVVHVSCTAVYVYDAPDVCSGLYDSIYNHFDQPELLDDVTDHWRCATLMLRAPLMLCHSQLCMCKPTYS